MHVCRRRLSRAGGGGLSPQSRDKLVADLAAIVGSRGVLSDPDDTAPYRTDWKGIYKSEHDNAVVLPKSSEQVAEVVRYCHLTRVSVVPQGGNTGLVGGSVPQAANELVLSLRRMNQVLEVDEDSGIVSCEAGCILETLDNHINQMGLCMPLDLGAKGSCQIGGNISTNAGGIRLLRYGSLRENTLGLEVVQADGSRLPLMNTVRKDNTGTSVKQLFIGTEGTLGIITQAAILCPPVLPSKTICILAVPDFPALLTCLRAAKRSLAGVLSAFEMMDRESLRLVQSQLGIHPPFPLDTELYALIETAGSGEEQGQTQEFLEQLFSKGVVSDGVVASDMEQGRKIWTLRESVTEAVKKAGVNYKYDISLPMSHFYRLAQNTRRDWSGRVAHVTAYGHVGDGNLHLNMVDREMDRDKYHQLSTYIYEYVASCGGSISAEHGIGREKQQYLPLIHPPAYLARMRAIKTLFDPHNTLNPGKYYGL